MERIVTILGADRTPLGPFSLQEVESKIASGEVPADVLAHTPGLSNWHPLSQVMAHLSAQRPGAIYVPPQNVYQPNAGAMVFAVAGYRFASFPSRMAALILDTVFFLVGFLAIVFLAYLGYSCLMLVIILAGGKTESGTDGGPTSYEIFVGLMGIILFIGFPIFAVLFAIFGSWLYHAKMESGAKQGTLGKQIMGIRVTDLQGNRITFMRATGRHFARLALTNHTMGIGYLIALGNDRKQAIHDLVAKTIVIES